MIAQSRDGGTRSGWRWVLLGGGAALAGLILAAPPPAPVEAQAPTPTHTPTATPTATPTPFVYDDSDTYLTYSGIWNTIQDSKARSGSLHQSREENARMRMRFSGPYFKWYAVRGPNRGKARVTVDGVELSGSPFDLYRLGEPAYEIIVWQGGLDSERAHNLVIEVLGERNGASSDSLVDIDAIEVAGAERPPLTPTPTPSPTGGPTATQTPAPAGTPGTPGTPVAGTPLPVGTDRTAGSWPIDTRFLNYYVRYDGLRILGNTISPPTFYAGRFAQYFEKGRMEDHTGESNDPNWQFQYGLLSDELQTSQTTIPIGGEVSTLDYSKINALAQEGSRLPAPATFTGGVATNSDGSIFIPYSQALRPGPGHNVSPIFWPYMNRQDIFPGGWLHDIGLPMTEAIPAVVTKGTSPNRQILVQVFQRTILTYDPMNPADFQVERANVGSDYRRVYPDRVPQ